MAEDVSLRESLKLIAEHRKEAHGLGLGIDQQKNNRTIREQGDEELLRTLTANRWDTARELAGWLDVAEQAVRRRLRRLETEGRVLSRTQDGVLVYKRAARKQ
ncbi:MAG: hypothetical protein H0W90_08080 [Actinobacteria bacterium]|nr:hypothetical protein [Actinomycetota bacterium]